MHIDIDVLKAIRDKRSTASVELVLLCLLILPRLEAGIGAQSMSDALWRVQEM